MSKMLKLFLKESWLLIIAAFCFGLLLSFTYIQLTPKIEQNMRQKINTKLGSLIKAEEYEKIGDYELVSLKRQPMASTVYKAVTNGQVQGWGFTTQGSGFADKIELIVALSSDLSTIKGYAVLASNETPGFGTKIVEPYFKTQFADIPAKPLELEKTGNPDIKDTEIIAISGATVSSSAVVNIINNALEQIKEKMKDKGLL